MEACLLSLSNTNIAEIGEKSPKIAKTWKQFKSNIQKPIAVILIINTLAHTIGAAISGARFDTLFGSQWIWVFSLLYSLFMIQYTEILPKTLGVRFNILLAKLSALPLFFLIKVFHPFIALIEFANKPFEKRTQEDANSVAHEITLLASSAVYDKTLSQEQALLISKSIQMSTLKARDIMVEKDHIISLNTGMNLTEAFLASHIHRHTRYPLTDDQQSVLGYVNFKDIVTALHISPEDPSLKGLCRPLPFISEDTPLNILLRKMIREHQHMAMVNDTQKTLIGLVTLEDVIESLVGDIEDEFDRPPELIIKLAENRWRIGGGVSINQIRKEIGGDIPESMQTIDQLIKSRVQGNEQVENFQFYYHGILIRVRRVVRGYIYDVIMEKPVKS